MSDTGVRGALWAQTAASDHRCGCHAENRLKGRQGEVDMGRPEDAAMIWGERMGTGVQRRGQILDVLVTLTVDRCQAFRHGVKPLV